jgi:biotin carboxylase
MVHHILLIGGSREVHPKIKQQGLRLTLLFNLSTLKNRKNMEIYERLIGISPLSGVEEWLEMARLIHRIDPFDCIGGFNESTQAIAAAISQDLKLEFHTPTVIESICQKHKMRDLLRVAGFDDTGSAVVESVEDIAAFAAKYSYPIVLKPLDGRGSLSVSILRDDREINAAIAQFQSIAPEHKMLVEQFLEGEEWSIEAFSEQGLHQVICITQKFKDARTSVETGHCLPALFPETVRQEIEGFVGNVLTTLGIVNGPSHTELIMNANGPRIVETHVRLGGDSIVEMIRLVSGIDMDELWIRQVSGERVLDRVPSRLDRLERFAAISFVTPHAVGTLARVDGVAEAAAMPGVEQVEVLYSTGAEVQGAYNSASRGACVIALSNHTPDEAITRAQTAAEQLRFVILCAG